MGQKRVTGIICLLVAAVIWGLSFVSQVQGMESMSALFFNAVRFTIGAMTLIPLMIARRVFTRQKELTARLHAEGDPETDAEGPLPTKPRWVRAISKPIPAGLACGVCLTFAGTLQQYGMLYGRSASRAGFITDLYIIIVPFLAYVLLRRAVHAQVFLSLIVAIVGFYLLAMVGGSGAMSIADLLLLLSAFAYAAQIVVVDVVVDSVNPLLLSFMQFMVIAIVSWIGAIAEGSVVWYGIVEQLPAVLYSGIGSVGVAYTLQVIGQQWVAPTQASLLMSLESPFSAVGGVLILGETMSAHSWIGCALIFIGIIVAQIPVTRLRRDKPDVTAFADVNSDHEKAQLPQSQGQTMQSQVSQGQQSEASDQSK